MLFKNKIEYTKELFVEIYRTEMKKVLLVLRIITGLAVAAAILFMIYGAVPSAPFAIYSWHRAGRPAL